MEPNEYLLEAFEELNEKYCCTIPEPNVMQISIEPDTTPFALVVIEPDAPDTLVVSLAIDFQDNLSVADVVLSLHEIMPVTLAEGFYLDQNNTVHWGTDALNRNQLENNQDIKEIPTINNFKH